MKTSEVITYGKILPEAVNQAKNSLIDGNIVRLMADHHIGYGVPIGGVVASKNKISIHGVGFDIGCGNNALELDLTIDQIKDNLVEIGKDISQMISFGVGRKNSLSFDTSFFKDDRFNFPLWKELKTKAQEQFGTVGSGNHYVDVLFSQKTNRVYLANHFGSRGFGHSIATKFYGLYNSGDGMNSLPVYADLDTQIGKDYKLGMELAGEYALRARTWVLETINKQIFKAKVVTDIKNHHNFSWKESHFGEDYWVTRKGATPLYLDQPSFIGGTMTTNSYIVKGKESQQYYETLRSTVHGAGRVISRTQASGGRRRKGQPAKKGLYSDVNLREFAKEHKILLFGAGADELPMCYKDIDEVIEHHSDSLEIVDVLTPVIVLMAGADEFDPYKD